MEKGLSVVKPGQLVIPGTLTETSLELLEDLSYEEWAAVGETLGRMERAVGWWVGDWAIYGQPRYEKWQETVDRLALSERTARRCIQVASFVGFGQRWPNLSFLHHELVATDKLSEDEKRHWLQLAVGPPKLSVAQLRRAMIQKRAAGRIAALPPLPPGIYRTVVADPPWPYPDTATRGAAEDHYETLTLDKICAYQVKDDEGEKRKVRELAPEDGAHLYLWTPGRHLRDGQALEVVRAWGFEPATMLTWVKPQMGIGKWFRSASEYVIFCTREGLPLTVQEKAYPNWFTADRREHSEKPDEFYDLVETVSPGPFLDLFGRGGREGWTVFGLEAQ